MSTRTARKPGIGKIPVSAVSIDITYKCPLWESCGFDVEAAADSAIRATIESSPVAKVLKNHPADISVVLGDDNFIRTLNREYRGKDKATNVLSFPQSDFSTPGAFSGPASLGDVILAYQTIERESRAQEKSFQNHFCHLVVHGTLHLMGYDHETPEEAEVMESLEIEILNSIDVENPYSDVSFMA